MPDIHFVGEIEYAAIDSFSQISVTYAIVPGSSAWLLKGGKASGETHTTVASQRNSLIFNHPIDAHYDASSAEGWPFFVCEVSSQYSRHCLSCTFYLGRIHPNLTLCIERVLDVG